MSKTPVVIFVRPIAQGNIGALARVMSNFGVSDLRLVKEARGDAPFDKEANPIDWGLACRGEKILRDVKVYPSLAAALHDIHWAVGTSARPREGDSGYTRPVESFSSVLEKIENKKGAAKWALVLGTENDGLSDAELSHCHLITTIPTHHESPSMNVAMAAGCLLYHWSQNTPANTRKTEKDLPPNLATAREIEQLSSYIAETLKLSDFYKYPDEVATLARIQRVFQKEEPLSRGDILFLFEIFYQLRSKIQGYHSERNFLKNDAGEG